MDESSRKLESLVESQRDRIHRLEDLVKRWTRRDHSGLSRAETLAGLEIGSSEANKVVEDDGLVTPTGSENATLSRRSSKP